MHQSALKNCDLFFRTYKEAWGSQDIVHVVDVGAQDVNGSLKAVCPENFKYVGVDFVEGAGVDIVLEDPYELPFENSSVDIVLSSSCFEHSEMFWLSFLEILRILKPSGLFYLNVPSNGSFHRYPVDCWRFYPDSGVGLVSWAQRNGLDAVLLESYISDQDSAPWNDYVAIFLKDANFLKIYERRILDQLENFKNGRTNRSSEFLKYERHTEDQIKFWRPVKYCQEKSE